MEMRAEFSKETIDEIFSTMTVDQLSQVREVFFSCDSNPHSPRYLCISTFWPRIAGWDGKRWIPQKTDDLEDFKTLEDEEEKARVVVRYYKNHEQKLKPIIRTVSGQIHVEDETGVIGGSLNLYLEWQTWHTEVERDQQMVDTIRAFLLLTSAFNNRGESIEDQETGEVKISFKSFRHSNTIPVSRIKIITESTDFERVFLKIHRILAKDPSIPPFYFRYKTLVATYLDHLFVTGRWDSYLSGYTWNIERILREMKEKISKIESINGFS